MPKGFHKFPQASQVIVKVIGYSQHPDIKTPHNYVTEGKETDVVNWCLTRISTPIDWWSWC